jgi:hypothetical protein
MSMNYQLISQEVLDKSPECSENLDELMKEVTELNDYADQFLVPRSLSFLTEPPDRAAPAERSEARQFLVLCKNKLGNSKSFQERSPYQTFLCDGQFISLTEY